MSYLSLNNNVFMKSYNYLPTDNSITRNRFDKKKTTLTENNNQISSNGTTTTTTTDKTVEEVWTSLNFDTKSTDIIEIMSWGTKKITMPIFDDDDDGKTNIIDNNIVQPYNNDEEAININEKNSTSPSHHARRPMNAFLIFCKKHRPIVREKFPNLENRGVTRILGEWWALLDDVDKAPYTDLAKEYKDAFLSANPDFKWYKLPAPPLRTLNTRPLPPNSVGVGHQYSNNKTPTTPTTESEFNLGKLADESQLGSLTNLMNNNIFSSSMRNRNDEKTLNEFNNNIEYSQINVLKTTTPPPKPLKKRINEQYLKNGTITRKLLNDTSVEMPKNSNNITNQDLMNKVVDSIFTVEQQQQQQQQQQHGEKSTNKEIRKLSGRQCKGKLYEKFMVEGKLLGNKRDVPLLLTSQKVDDTNQTTPKLDLSNTIKRLAERTRLKFVDQTNVEEKSNEQEQSNNSISETTSFNLDSRISNLPSQSYDIFWQRKKESKKRKSRNNTKTKIPRSTSHDEPIGSKKRKNKQSITHLELKEEHVAIEQQSFDLLGLATLAEVAANTEKIQPKISE